MAGVRQTSSSGVVQTTSGVSTTVAETLIDSFEDGDLTEYSGDTGEIAVTAEGNLSFSAVDGSNVLEHTSSDAFSRIYSESGDGLSNYFAKGNEAKIAVRATAVDENLLRVLFGVATANSNLDRYQAELRYGENNFRLSKVVGGTYTNLAEDTNASFTADTWGVVTITWDDGSLGGSDNDISLDYSEGGTSQASTGPTSDSDNATNDGIGYVGANTSAANFYWDYYRIP